MFLPLIIFFSRVKIACYFFPFYSEVKKMKRQLNLIDYGGQRISMKFGRSATVAKILAWAAANSIAGVTGIDTIEDLEVEVTAAQPNADLERKCFVTARNDTGETVRFVIPAPIVGGVLGEDGERLEASVGQSICDDYAILYGADLIFQNGTFTEKE